MIRLEGLNKSYGQKLILKDVTYHFPTGERVALVGGNGVGKTTLLNIICGLEEPDSGVTIRPRDCVIGYLPQEPNPNPIGNLLQECVAGHLRISELMRARDSAQSKLVAFGDSGSLEAFERAQASFQEAGGTVLESRARSILTGLGFRPTQFEIHPKTLSGGWRMRLELAKVFLNDPRFLVLDEPTNHLDLPSLVWVENYLRQFRGCLVFVSHDRGLLNRLSTITLHLSRGHLRAYKGDFDSFLEQKEQYEQQDIARAEAISRRKSELTRFVERFGAKATKARQAQARVKMIARLQDLEDDIDLPQKENAMVFSFPTAPSSGRDVLKIEELAIGYQSAHPLSVGIHLNIARGQKICVIGANGIGKSTLLQTLAGVIPQLSGKYELGIQVTTAYFAQDQLSVLNAQKTVLENLLARTNLSEKEARSLLGAFLFRGDDVFKQVGVLSGGEKNRLGLALVLSLQANFLLLDEPTNHLDMSSAEILSEALQDYEGTVFCVSHDREFINSFATHIFVMLPGGQHALFEGNLEDYPRLAQVSGFPNIFDASCLMPDSGQQNKSSCDKEARLQQRADAQALKRERQRLQKKIDDLEKLMSGFTEELRTLDERLEQVGSDFSLAKELTDEQITIRGKLEEVENEWLTSSEQILSLSSELENT